MITDERIQEVIDGLETGNSTVLRNSNEITLYLKELIRTRQSLKEAVREMRQDIDLHSERNPLSGCYGTGLNQAIRILRKHNLIEEEL